MATVSVTIRIDTDLWRRVKQYAASSRPAISANSAVNWLLDVGLQATTADRLTELAILAQAIEIVTELGNRVDTPRDSG